MSLLWLPRADDRKGRHHHHDPSPLVSRDNFLIIPIRTLPFFAGPPSLHPRGGSLIIYLAGAQVPPSRWHDNPDITNNNLRLFFIYFGSNLQSSVPSATASEPSSGQSAHRSIQLPASLVCHPGVFDTPSQFSPPRRSQQPSLPLISNSVLHTGSELDTGSRRRLRRS